MKKNSLKINSSFFFNCPTGLTITKNDYEDDFKKVQESFKILINGNSNLLYDGNTLMTGWLNLPEYYLNENEWFLDEIINAARVFRQNIEVFISLGIGGSYLGIEASTNALLDQNFNLIKSKNSNIPFIFFAGNHLSIDEINSILSFIRNKKIGICVISKSGSTIETSIIFRLFRDIIIKNQKQEEKYIISITDINKGSLRDLTNLKGYNKPYFTDEALKLFCIPHNIGGRYSITSPVGLFSLAAADIDIKKFLLGAKNMQDEINNNINNPAFIRAATRFAAIKKGAKIENIVSNTKSLYGLSKWSRQLFPESEGKNKKGMWVSIGFYTEDAHSIGQLISAGERNIIETYLTLENIKNDISIPESNINDGISYLDKKNLTISDINKYAIKSLQYDHFNRGVPVLEYIFPELDEYILGQYFQCEMNACILCCLMQDINAVNQPDVEGYKNAMYAMLDRPGYEILKQKINEFYKNLE